MATKKILCIGGSGQLGAHVAKGLLPNIITNVDFKQCPNSQSNILLKKSSSVSENNKEVLGQLKKLNTRFDSIIVTAGGWVGGSIKDEDYFAKCQQMLDMNLSPSLLGAHIATRYLNDNGLVILTGAAAVFKEPQPDMLAYAIAKTGVHSLALNLTETFLKQGKGQRVVTLLPETIDTETNRKAMPNADFASWSKPTQIAQLIRAWVDGLNVPNNGSFALLKVKNECVMPDFV